MAEQDSHSWGSVSLTLGCSGVLPETRRTGSDSGFPSTGHCVRQGKVRSAPVPNTLWEGLEPTHSGCKTWDPCRQEPSSRNSTQCPALLPAGRQRQQQAETAAGREPCCLPTALFSLQKGKFCYELNTREGGTKENRVYCKQSIKYNIRNVQIF